MVRSALTHMSLQHQGRVEEVDWLMQTRTGRGPSLELKESDPRSGERRLRQNHGERRAHLSNDFCIELFLARRH